MSIRRLGDNPPDAYPLPPPGGGLERGQAQTDLRPHQRSCTAPTNASAISGYRPRNPRQLARSNCRSAICVNGRTLRIRLSRRQLSQPIPTPAVENHNGFVAQLLQNPAHGLRGRRSFALRICHNHRQLTVDEFRTAECPTRHQCLALDRRPNCIPPVHRASIAKNLPGTTGSQASGPASIWVRQAQKLHRIAESTSGKVTRLARKKAGFAGAFPPSHPGNSGR